MNIVHIKKPITINSPGIIKDTHFINLNRGVKTLIINSDDVILENIRITGVGANEFVPDNIGVFAENVKNLKIKKSIFEDLAGYGVLLNNVSGSNVDKNLLTNIHHAGIFGNSIYNTTIDKNKVSGIVSKTGYGISASKLTTDEHIDDKPSTLVWMRKNLVEDCDWRAIDTHSGILIYIRGNAILNCNSGIGVGGATNYSTGKMDWAPSLVEIIDNFIDSRKRATATFGICVTGCDANKLATDCSVINNTVIEHGNPANPYDAALYFHTTLNLIAELNKVLYARPTAINLWNDNYNFTVARNHILSPYSNNPKSGYAAGITCWSTPNTGKLLDNKIWNDGKIVAEWVLNVGIRTREDEPGFEGNRVYVENSYSI